MSTNLYNRELPAASDRYREILRGVGDISGDLPHEGDDTFHIKELLDRLKMIESNHREIVDYLDRNKITERLHNVEEESATCCVNFTEDSFTPYLNRFKLIISHNLHGWGTNYYVASVSRKKLDSDFQGNIAHQHRILINGDLELVVDIPFNGTIVFKKKGETAWNR